MTNGSIQFKSYLIFKMTICANRLLNNCFNLFKQKFKQGLTQHSEWIEQLVDKKDLLQNQTQFNSFALL